MRRAARVLRVINLSHSRCLVSPISVIHSPWLRWYSAEGGDETPLKTADKEKLDLAKPGKNQELNKETSYEKENQNESSSSSSSDSESSSDSDSDNEQELEEAAKKVAQSLEGDPHQIENDLLQQLQRHKSHKGKETKKKESVLSSLMSGMRIEQSRGGKKGRSGIGQQRQIGQRRQIPEDESPPHSVSQSFNRAGEREAEARSVISKMTARTHRTSRNENFKDVKLFSGSALNIFSKKTSTAKKVSSQTQPSLFTVIEQEELQRQLEMLPSSTFEEMIEWTKAGKLWKFPINNEQALVEEAKVSFQEHVFLEKHLSSFPSRGPIRHFVELVAVGLSKNPYYTVQEKIDHIMWFKNYFDDKKQIIDSVIVEEKKEGLSTETVQKN